MSDNGDSLLTKVAITAIVVLFSPLGFFFEPTPISEIASLAILASVWGIDALDDLDA